MKTRVFSFLMTIFSFATISVLSAKTGDPIVEPNPVLNAITVDTGMNQGPAVLRLKGAAGLGTALYLNQHLRFVEQSQLSNADVWEFIEVGNGEVVLRCPTRGYLVAGMFHNNVLNLGYHQYERTATRFTIVTGADGYNSYKIVSNNSNYSNFFLGSWQDKFVIRNRAGDATSIKMM